VAEAAAILEEFKEVQEEVDADNVVQK